MQYQRSFILVSLLSAVEDSAKILRVFKRRYSSTKGDPTSISYLAIFKNHAHSSYKMYSHTYYYTIYFTYIVSNFP